MAATILVIDDDTLLLKLIRQALTPKGYIVHTATNGDEGLLLFNQVAPDLVILDVMMPGMSGWDVCERLRQVSSVPIIFLTALDSVDDIVSGLTGGADDYLVKPFRIAELAARVSALLRRVRMSYEKPRVISFGNGDLVINLDEQMVFAYGEEVPLSPIEYNLLVFLAERAGRIIPSRVLFDAIWGTMADAGTQSVKWYIWSLRKKIEKDPQHPRFILTERGKGYRFSPN